LCGLFGYDEEKSWGHITSGGTVANYEAMWVARNIRSLADALAEVRPDLMEGFNEIQKANLPIDTLLSLLARSKEDGDLDAVRRATAQYRGANASLGKVLVPQSKHYSWTKALDILGLGQNAMVPIPVGTDFRMDTEYLKKTVTNLIESGTPIMAVVTVTGTTESGAVDPVHHVTALRRELREKLGVGFYLHVDG
ncbi:MAG: tyrosine decarboxylase, partial [Candidatus Eremiobacteraeota bacterium]|nr:tyrosine decarboxylase [Candidatus Eremiobacteraeota bacterium]